MQQPSSPPFSTRTTLLFPLTGLLIIRLQTIQTNAGVQNFAVGSKYPPTSSNCTKSACDFLRTGAPGPPRCHRQCRQLL